MRLFEIAKVYLRYQYYPYLIGSLVGLLCLPMIASFKHLEMGQGAQIIDKFFSLMGLFLLVPLFTPDLNKGILSVIRSRDYPYGGILVIRLLIEWLTICLVLICLLVGLIYGQSVVPFWPFFLGGLANVCFMGGLGLAAYSLSDQPILGLMVPILYYVANFGGAFKCLQVFYLFGLAEGLSSKWWLGVVGVGLIFMSMYYRHRHKV